jgi:hypothetical protein
LLIFEEALTTNYHKVIFYKTLKTTLQNTELCTHVKQIYKLAAFYFTLSDLGKFFQIDEGQYRCPHRVSDCIAPHICRSAGLFALCSISTKKN